MNNTILFILALFSIFTIRKTSSADFHYEVCKVPKHCGDQLIKYPFYLKNEQDAFCGYPEFEVTCKNNNTMIRINDSGDEYIIRDIFYRDHTFRVSSPAFDILDDKSKCFPLIHNFTVSTLRREFNMTTYPGNMYLLYNCSHPGSDKLPRFRHGCSGENVSLIAPGKGYPRIDDVSKNCSQTVSIPVEAADEGDESSLIELLRKGFLLNWTASSCNECEQSGGHCGFNSSTDIYKFQCYCVDRPHYKSCVPGNVRFALKIGLGIGFPVIIMIGLVVYFLHRKRKRKHGSPDTFSTSNSSYPSNEDLEEGSVYYGVPVFSYKELEEATNNFDHSKELGDGGFGTVYYGKLRDGREVAVKRLYEHNYRRVEQFMNEIEILTRLRHKHLVSLYGCTSRKSRELLLVYEYIPNGTVADHLHGDRAKPGSLTWSTRMSIAVETANALAYLHASDIIHRDVKTNNILLDINFSVKVADFGLSRLFPIDVTHVSTAPQGTPGYVDPDYHQCYQLTDKSDVYSFGVVLVELISSMPAVDISRHRHEINLSNMAIAKIQKKAYNELVDPTLGFESDSSVKKMVMMVAELAFRCLQQDKEMRPSMDEVLEALQEIESGELELVSIDKAHIKNVESESVLTPPSPECDEVGLLKRSRQPSSPISVTEKWISRSTTPNSSA